MGTLSVVAEWLCMVLGTVIGFMYGDITPLMYALIAIIAMDCITGLAVAVRDKKVSSKVCFEGLCRKFLILLMIACSHIIDYYVTNTYPVIQSAVMLFFIAHEAISCIENAAALGVPIPRKLLDVLANIQKESGGEATKEEIEKANEVDKVKSTPDNLDKEEAEIEVEKEDNEEIVE